MKDIIRDLVADSLRVKTQFFDANADKLVEVAAGISRNFTNGGKMLLFGNGGSAADAQHIATELVGRFVAERAPLPAMSLSTDTSLLTAVSNDCGFESIFARQILALGRAGDTAIAISTSGNSPNVIRGIQTARSQGLFIIGLSGETGGQMNGMVDVLFCVPSRNTPRIQEAHIMIGHIICELVERQMFPDLYPRD